MAYCRFGQGDVFLYATGDVWVCLGCLSWQRSDVTLTTLSDVRRHLLHHRESGHKVPQEALNMVDHEIANGKTIEFWYECDCPECELTDKDIPLVNPREPLDDDKPDGYLVSDLDFVRANLEAAVWFLENAERIREALK